MEILKEQRTIRFSHGTGEGSKNNQNKSRRRSINRAKDVAIQIDSIYNDINGVKSTGAYQICTRYLMRVLVISRRVTKIDAFVVKMGYITCALLVRIS